MKILPALCLVLALAPASAGAQTAAPSDGAFELKVVLELKGDPVRGKAAFRDCAGCHRKDASGRAKRAIPRLSGQHAPVILKQMVDIREGRRINTPMKPILHEPQLTPQTFADIASYLQSLPIEDSQQKGPVAAVERGRALFARDCAGCHGAAGQGRPENFYPMVAAQHFGYLARELALVRDGGRGNSNPVMAALLGTYAQQDLQAVAAYMAQLPPPQR